MNLGEWYQNLSGLEVLVLWVVTMALVVWVAKSIIGQGTLKDE